MGDRSRMGSWRSHQNRRAGIGRQVTRSPVPRILVTPRNEENPYLPLLRQALRDVGVVSDWLPMDWSPSQTLNVMFFPVELGIRSAARLQCHSRSLAIQVLLALGQRHLPFVRRLPRWWFGFTLWFADAIGFCIVYTSHELLPLAPVFDDDTAGRRSLLHRARAVLTITEDGERRLSSGFGVDPRLIRVIPEGAPVFGPAPERRGRPKTAAVSGAMPLSHRDVRAPRLLQGGGPAARGRPRTSRHDRTVHPLTRQRRRLDVCHQAQRPRPASAADRT